MDKIPLILIGLVCFVIGTTMAIAGDVSDGAVRVYIAVICFYLVQKR